MNDVMYNKSEYMIRVGFKKILIEIKKTALQQEAINCNR